MQVPVVFTLLIVGLLHLTNGQWWGSDSFERSDDYDDYSPWAYGRGRGHFGGMRRRFNRWGSDEDDFDDDDWNIYGHRFASRGFNRMAPRAAPRRNTWGSQSSFRTTQGAWPATNQRQSRRTWSSPNSLSALWMMRDYDTPDFFDFFG